MAFDETMADVPPFYCVRSLHHCHDDALLPLLLDKSVQFTLLNKKIFIICYNVWDVISKNE